MIKIGIALMCFILAGGAVDGPTGHELDNWGLAFSLLAVGIFFSVWGVFSVDTLDN